MPNRSFCLSGQSSLSSSLQPWNIFQLSHIKFQQLHTRPAELQLINLHACKYVQMDTPFDGEGVLAQRQQQRIWLNWLASAAKALRAQFAYIRFVIIIVDHRFKWGSAAAAARSRAGRNWERERERDCAQCVARTVMICRAHLHPAACGRLSDAHSLIKAAQQRATAAATAAAAPRHGYGLMSSLWSFSPAALLVVVALWPPSV